MSKDASDLGRTLCFKMKIEKLNDKNIFISNCNKNEVPQFYFNLFNKHNEIIKDLKENCFQLITKENSQYNISISLLISFLVSAKFNIDNELNILNKLGFNKLIEETEKEIITAKQIIDNDIKDKNDFQ
jgi:hypothetical protein